MTAKVNNRTPDEPEGFVPYESIKLCSNLLVHVRHIFVVQGHHPIIIGKGPIPLVWMSVPKGPKLGKEWALVVERNKSNHPDFEVIVNGTEEVTVKLHGILELIYVRKVSDLEIAVDRIDLRPFGLAIWGEPGELRTGVGSFVGNHLEGASAFMEVS